MCGGAERTTMKEKNQFQKFCKQMKEAVQKLFSKEMQVEIHKVVKNNSLELDSLVILGEDKLISPNFYLQLYYEEYQKGETVEELAKQIKTLYDEALLRESHMEVDLSYESCASQIVFRLVSYEKNEKLLQEVPYISFLDLAVVFYVLLRKDQEGIGSIRISNRLMEKWELNTGALFTLARENTERIFPERICSMYYLMEDMLHFNTEGEIIENEKKGKRKERGVFYEPYVVTNDNGINGAAVILYPDTLRKVGNILEDDFYLLPSSIHEMLAIPVSAAISEKDLYDMVWEVNRTCVAKEEVLSGAVYQYTRETETIKICERD